MSDDVQHDLGRHEQQLIQQAQDISEMKASLKNIEAKFSEISGGKKAITLLVAAAAAAGGFVHWVLTVVMHKPDGVP